ncbi:MAG: cytochrome c peroxidase, partial [Acidobacteriota bacterium]
MTLSVKAKLVPLAVALLIAACAQRTEKIAPSQSISPAPGNTQAVFKLNAPLGLDLASVSFFVPDDNPLTEPKLKLGKRLFFDTFLSVDATVSCASCHLPAKGFADPN